MSLRLAIPKGRMFDGIRDLLAAAGLRLSVDPRGYRPILSMEGVQTKLLKPQDIVSMLSSGTRELGFAGADWVAEHTADVVELLDTGMDPVQVVVAAPPGTNLKQPGLRIASEYRRLTEGWMAANNPSAVFVRSYGATEVFPPEDADCIIDNTATGSTLRANNLQIVGEVMRSSTRLYASRAALQTKRAIIDEIVLLLRSVLDARQRVMLEVNVPADKLEAVAQALPCMREPTVSQLHAGVGFAVKAAVPKRLLPELIPELKRRGGNDILVSSIAQIVP